MLRYQAKIAEKKARKQEEVPAPTTELKQLAGESYYTFSRYSNMSTFIGVDASTR
jgi:hypothetical protein